MKTVENKTISTIWIKKTCRRSGLVEEETITTRWPTVHCFGAAFELVTWCFDKHLINSKIDICQWECDTVLSVYNAAIRDWLTDWLI